MENQVAGDVTETDNVVTEQRTDETVENTNKATCEQDQNKDDGAAAKSDSPIVQQPTRMDHQVDPSNVIVSGDAFCPSGLESLLDSMQLVVHKDNFRLNEIINDSALNRYEVVDDMRKVLFFIEQVPESEDGLNSFKFAVYNRAKEEVMRVFCPSSRVCLCCGASWHCMRRCHLQAIVYAPPGTIAGFVKRQQTCFVQDFGVLDSHENPQLCLRGGLTDLEVYSADCVHELGRLSVHGWVGIMHELRRTSQDWGVTYPIDLDIRMKASLLGTLLVVDWLNMKAHR